MVSSALAGVFRSLRTYHGDAARQAAMDALYRRFVAPGDLAFDIGAHVGDRVSSLRRIGARVIAIEPQPLLVRALRHIHGRDPGVLIIPAALAAESGERVMHINSRNPTVSTISEDFMLEASGAEGWEGQTWDARISVPAITLDRLVATFGAPAFVKIDVEGFEDEVLRGLSQPLPALSFEFTTIARAVAVRAIEHLERLGGYGYDVALGESQRLTFERWVGAAEMIDHLSTLPHEANSGDVYALRADTG